MTDEVLQEIVICNGNSNHSFIPIATILCTSNATVTNNVTTYSVLQPAKTHGSHNLLPSVQSFVVLNTIPGGAHLSHTDGDLGTPL